MSGVDSGTSASILTADGPGAIAVVRVWGPRAIEAADSLFRPARPPSLLATRPGRPRFGTFGPDPGEEVVVIVLPASPPSLEIHCHGGFAAVRRVCDLLGAEIPSGWTPLAFRIPDGREGPSYAINIAETDLAFEAQAALMHATTLRVAQILQDQADGALAREWAALDAEAESDPPAAIRRIDALLRRADVGTRLLSGWTVVLAGRPNVGKSRLLNALAGSERAIVSPRAGTTRDLVTAHLAIDGWPVEVCDTAGLREAGDRLERAGMAMTRDRAAAADLVLLVFDRSAPLTDEDRAILRDWPAGRVVANKSDLPAAWDTVEFGAVAVSAETGEGMPGLLDAIAELLVPELPEAGVGVPFTGDQVEALRARRAILDAS